MAEGAYYKEIHGKYLESRQKFIYFILGADLALLSFSLQSFNPAEYQHLIWLAPFSWASLVTALVSGIYHAEQFFHTLSYEALRLQIEGENQRFVNASKVPEGDISKINKEMETNNSRLKKISEIQSKIQSRLLYSYKIMLYSSLSGVVVLGVLKTINL